MTTVVALADRTLLDANVATPEHTYTYLFCDLLTDEVLAELPMADVTYSTELNGIGVLRGTVPYADETLPLDPETATAPNRTVVYVDRDGVIVWGGIIWTRQPATGGKEIQAAEFLSYYQHRYVKTTLSTDTSFLIDTDMVPNGQRLYADQRFLVWSLFAYANAQGAGADIKLDVSSLSVNADGIARNITYFGFERPEIYKCISELAGAEDGFDYAVECGWSPSANNLPPKRYRRMRTWFPRRGRTADASGLVFSKGGSGASILDYNWPENGTALATEVSALGDGTGEAKVTAAARDEDLLASGWPLLEAVTTYDGVVDTAQLQGLANSELTARSGSQTQPTFTVSADTDPAFGSYSVGDEGLFIIDPEPQSPAGRSGNLRIVSIENTAAAGPERVRLTCVEV